MCNGKGKCVCGVCQCEKSQDGMLYEGRTCGKCVNCPHPCHVLKDCVHCLAFGSGLGSTLHNKTSQHLCSRDCGKHNITVDMVDNLAESILT